MRNFCPIVFHSLTDALPVRLRFRSVTVCLRYLRLCLITEFPILSSIFCHFTFYGSFILPLLIVSNDSRKVKVIGKIKGKIITPNCWRLSTPTIPGILNKGDNR